MLDFHAFMEKLRKIPVFPTALEQAEKTTVPIELESLAHHSDPAVRVTVAGNSHARRCSIERLAADKDPAVRVAVLESPYVAWDIKERICNSAVHSGADALPIRIAVAKFSYVSDDVLLGLFWRFEWPVSHVILMRYMNAAFGCWAREVFNMTRATRPFHY